MLFTIATILHERYAIGWLKLRRILAGCLVISFGIICTYIFSLFWIQGPVIITEPNKFILLSETVMSLLIIAFGIELFART
jgi:hypothetical protein